MQIISKFYGMVVKMYYLASEHNPPHIHVIYGEYIGVINLLTLEMMQGDLPNKALSIIKDWTSIHRDELIEMWTTQEFKSLSPIY